MDREPENLNEESSTSSTSSTSSISSYYYSWGTSLFTQARQWLAPTEEEVYDRAVHAVTAKPVQKEIVKGCIKTLYSFNTDMAERKILLLYFLHINKVSNSELGLLKHWFRDEYPDKFPAGGFLFKPPAKPLLQEINEQLTKANQLTGDKKIQALRQVTPLLECAFINLKVQSINVHNSHELNQVYWQIAKTGDSSLLKQYLVHSQAYFFNIFIPYISKLQQLSKLDANACEALADAYIEYRPMQKFTEEEREEREACYVILLTQGATLGSNYCIKMKEQFEIDQKATWKYKEIWADGDDSSGSVVAQTWQAPFTDERIDDISNSLTLHLEYAESILDQKLTNLDSAIKLREALLPKIYSAQVAQVFMTEEERGQDFVVSLTHVKASILAHIILAAHNIEMAIDCIMISLENRTDTGALAARIINLKAQQLSLKFLDSIYRAGCAPFSKFELSLFISAFRYFNNPPNGDKQWFSIDVLVAVNPGYQKAYWSGDILNNMNDLYLSWLFDDINDRLARLQQKKYYRNIDTDRYDIERLFQFLFNSKLLQHDAVTRDTRQQLTKLIEHVLTSNNVSLVHALYREMSAPGIQSIFFYDCVTFLRKNVTTLSADFCFTLASLWMEFNQQQTQLPHYVRIQSSKECIDTLNALLRHGASLDHAECKKLLEQQCSKVNDVSEVNGKSQSSHGSDSPPQSGTSASWLTLGFAQATAAIDAPREVNLNGDGELSNVVEESDEFSSCEM